VVVGEGGGTHLRLAVGTQQRGERLASGPDGLARRRGHTPGGHAPAPSGRDEAVAAFVGPEVLGHTAVDIGQRPVATLDQVLGHRAADLFVVEADLREALGANLRVWSQISITGVPRAWA